MTGRTVCDIISTAFTGEKTGPAEAEREKEIKEAEGKAEAIRNIQKANADGIRMIREAGADEYVIKIKSLEAFQAAADGQATKIIIPSEIQGLAGVAAGLLESLKAPETQEKQ